MKLLKVIKFYITQSDSPYQKSIIEPQTILWMLEMMESQRYQKYLCCVSASVLLKIVTQHEIHFNYQEVAIIKKFNQALQNTEVFDLAEYVSSKSSGEEDDQPVEQVDNKAAAEIEPLPEEPKEEDAESRNSVDDASEEDGADKALEGNLDDSQVMQPEKSSAP
jgi:hypothetical protein